MPTRARWPFDPVQFGTGPFYTEQGGPVGLAGVTALLPI